MSNVVKKPDVAAPTPDAGNEGNGKAAANSIDVRTQSPFSRAGTLSWDQMALKIVYESFGTEHTVYLSPPGIRSLTGPGHFPADVLELLTGPDGIEIIPQEIGRAWRSRSGRALVITTPTSDGELMIPWQRFKKVVEHRIPSATVSRFNGPEKPAPRPTSEPQNAASITAGLEQGF